MKTDWIENVKKQILSKARLDNQATLTFDQVVKQASRKLGIRCPRREASEDMVCYTARIVKLFNLGRDFDRKIPDAQLRNRVRAKWSAFRNRQMGFRK